MAALTTAERPIWLDFDAIDTLCADRGATTEIDRADLLGVERSFLNRLRRGRVDITLGRVMAMAASLDVPVADIIAATPQPPTPPPTPPKPPPGPTQPRPPAGPKERQR